METVDGRLRRYYRLTNGGREAVEREADRMAAAARVVQTRGGAPKPAGGVA